MSSAEGFRYPIVFLPCPDLEAISDFYRGVLGLQVALDQGNCLIFRIGPRKSQGYIGFCKSLKPENVDLERIFLTLVVSTREEVDQWHKKLADLGVTCIKAPSDNPQYHIYNVLFRDPASYTLEIQAFEDEHSPQ